MREFSWTVIGQCVLFPKEHIYSLIPVTNALSCHGDRLSNMQARELPWGEGFLLQPFPLKGTLTLDTVVGGGLRNMF